MKAVIGSWNERTRTKLRPRANVRRNDHEVKLAPVYIRKMFGKSKRETQNEIASFGYEIRDDDRIVRLFDGYRIANRNRGSSDMRFASVNDRIWMIRVSQAALC